MIKKHLITCSVIVVLFIVSQLFICSTNFKRNSVSVPAAGTREGGSISPFIKYSKAANEEINFADENIPANNLRVIRKLNHSLRASSFSNIQSYALQEKAAILFPVIMPILRLYGIPDDFKYIPLVESGLNPRISSRGARGWWQFMPGTARGYGLKVGRGKDERMDIRKSTVAACIYLRELYSEYNNWTLTAAAYNLGTVKLNKAIRKNKKHNYFAMHLNRETGSYVYKLIAMKQVISKPGDYGYHSGYPWLQPPYQLLAANF